MSLVKRYLRQLNLVAPRSLTHNLFMVGIGGTGSWTTLALAKMGCQKITIIDTDTVEEHNLASQFYFPNQIGKHKTEALQQNIKQCCGSHVNVLISKGEQLPWKSMKPDIMILGVDTLEARKEIFNKMEPIMPDLYIDTRMGGELLSIFCVTPGNGSMEKYKKKLFNGKPAYEEECTSRAIVYNTFFCGGILANYVKKFANKEEIPFHLIFDIKEMEIVGKEVI